MSSAESPYFKFLEVKFGKESHFYQEVSNFIDHKSRLVPMEAIIEAMQDSFSNLSWVLDIVTEHEQIDSSALKGSFKVERMSTNSFIIFRCQNLLTTKF